MAQTNASTRPGEYPALARSKLEVKPVIWSSSSGKIPKWLDTAAMNLFLAELGQAVCNSGTMLGSGFGTRLAERGFTVTC